MYFTDEDGVTTVAVLMDVVGGGTYMNLGNDISEALSDHGFDEFLSNVRVVAHRAASSEFDPIEHREYVAGAMALAILANELIELVGPMADQVEFTAETWIEVLRGAAEAVMAAEAK